MRGWQNTLPCLCALSFRGEKRGVGICRQGIQPLLQKTKWKAQLCKNGPPDPTVALPFLPSAVSNISTEEQCQYLDLEEPET